MRTYAIGDVHGQLNMLERALAWVDQDAGDDQALIVFLGDYIDRGPDSCGVVAALMAGPKSPKHQWVCLKGNHEDMLVGAIDEMRAIAAVEGQQGLESAPAGPYMRCWWSNGGPECLASYVQRGFDGVVRDHVEWMRERPTLFVQDGRAFVHAYLNTSKTLSQQTRDSMLWSREKPNYYARRPMRDDDGSQLLVVHGHTPKLYGIGPAYLSGAVLNLDTGSCFGGHLSVAAWRGEEHPRVAQFSEHASNVLVWNEKLKGWKVKKEGC